ncbi:MAG: phosphoribosylamine--glycine ligase [Bacteroidota bacterium]|nr:phosphoribosylamine--glycine ligase [Bacteroidota bacterium]
MNILLLGSGGREHALAYKIVQSQRCKKLYVAPGNAGTSVIANNVSIDVNDFAQLKIFSIENDINMVVVGPEDPLVRGIYDFFENDPELKNIKVIGPSKEGAKLEGSKEYAKEFLIENNIPTAKYKSFDAASIEQGYAFLEELTPPFVLKADGLAQGKGVLIIDNLDDAKQELAKMLLENKFGSASAKVVIEEFLSGIELSCFVLTDGKNYKILPTAKDYKRVGEGDKGLNTGGMGAVSPVPFADAEFMQKIEEKIVKPTIQGLQKRHITYKGFVFIGLIKVGNEPYVIEYNVRMGDPETEVVMPRVQSDLVAVFEALDTQELDKINLEINPKSAVTVMLVSGGYPEDYQKGKRITGIDKVQDSVVFHAGTKLEGADVLTSGGRVLAVTSLADDFRKALEISYNNIQKINFDKMYYRSDIGFDL